MYKKRRTKGKDGNSRNKLKIDKNLQETDVEML